MKSKNLKKNCVRLSRMGCSIPLIHKRYPTTARCGSFCLLRFRPGPIRSSLDDLLVPGSPSPTISTSCLVRTSDRHKAVQDRTPNLTPSNSPSLQVAGLQESATIPGASSGFYLPYKLYTNAIYLHYFLDFHQTDR